MASTPIKHFVRLHDLFFTEDYAGLRTPIAMCADEAQADWLAWTLTRAHGCPVKHWGELEAEAAAAERAAAAGTSGGVPLAEETVERLANEAEAGYDPSKLKERPIGTCPPQCKCTAESGCLAIADPQPPVQTPDEPLKLQGLPTFPQHIDRDGVGHYATDLGAGPLGKGNDAQPAGTGDRPQ